jgi:hypothetical protein
MYGKLCTYGPWQIPYKACNVLCSDGKRRTARTAQSADTYFSLPARVSVRGKTVSGYITGCKTEGHADYEFHAVLTGKNAALLP